jgi:tetratricopeptide (TPR) repeat protein
MWYHGLTVVGALLAAPAANPAANPPSVEAMQEAQVHVQAAEDKMQAQAWDDAISELRAALALDSSLPIAYFNLGHCEMALKRYAEAEADYRSSAKAILERVSESEHERAQRYAMIEEKIQDLRRKMQMLGQGDLRTAAIEDRIRVLEASRPTEGKTATIPAELNVALGGACLRQGKFPEAEQAFKDALKVNSKLGVAHNTLAVLYRLTNRFQEANDEVKRAEKARFPVSPAFKKDLKEREKAATQSAQ